MPHKAKAMSRTAVFYLVLYSVSWLVALTRAAPSTESDIGDSNLEGPFGQSVDYNAMMTHFKDFFMYLPVVFSTFKDTMSGFPKLAESIKILTSPYDKPYLEDEDCKCTTTPATLNGNDIDKSSNRYR